MRQARISDANLRLVSKLNELKTALGDLTQLSTTNDANLVAAINEVLGMANQPSGAQINDAVTNLTEVWSSSRTRAAITGAINAALEGEDLSDLAAEITALTQADAGLISADTSQSLTPAQQQQARENIDAVSLTDHGDPDFDFLAEINSNLSF